MTENLEDDMTAPHISEESTTDNSEDDRQVGKNHAFAKVVMFHVKHRPTYMFHKRQSSR